MAQHQHQTSSSRATATILDGRSHSLVFFLPVPLLLSRLFYVSLLARTTHVWAIRYDWLDPRFRTNHFIKASVLNKPAFDYSLCHLVVIVPYTFSFLRTFRSNRFTSPAKNYLVVYPPQQIIDWLAASLELFPSHKNKRVFYRLGSFN